MQRRIDIIYTQKIISTYCCKPNCKKVKPLCALLPRGKKAYGRLKDLHSRFFKLPFGLPKKNSVKHITILKWVTICLAAITVCSSCGQTQPPPVQVPRDTTITRDNAVSEIFLDSLQVERFIETEAISDTAAIRFRNFYNSRNYQFAWFTKYDLAEQAGTFWNLYNNYIKYSQDSSLVNNSLAAQMALFQNGDTTYQPSAAIITGTELRLTKQFFDYVQHAYAGKINPEELKWHIPRKKVNAVELLDSLIAKKGANLESWEPLNRQYKAMKQKLLGYYDLSKRGGWDSLHLPKGKTNKKGDDGAFVKELKMRLALSADLPTEDSTGVFDETLKKGVQKAQKRFGLNPTGKVDASLVNRLNVPVEKRIEQILINMERMRWMPEPTDKNRIVANIPEFKIHVLSDTGEVFEMDVVVGKAGNNTVVFNDVLKYVVFSPYWNLPRSIVKSEIIPAMQRNANYLAQKNMEQTGVSNGVPIIRQKPGGANSLGKVKFIFPNNYNIYFHDTPAKSLFAKEKRDFSHGCIRLAEPKKLARYLLRNNPVWTDEKIAAAMNADVEKWVSLKSGVPVAITYFTAWVNAEGNMNFRDDIYNHDKEMSERLFLKKS